MKEWILSVGTTVIITTIVTIIIPEGKIGNYVKGIFSILVILVILKPMVSIFNTDYDFEEVFSQNVFVLQDDYLDFTNDKKIQNITEKCTKIIEEIGIENCVVNINYFVGKNNQIVIENVKIDLRNSVIISDKWHIDIIEDIKTTISDFLKIEQDRVIIYE